MSFYYNYTGSCPGTLRVNQANEAPASQPKEPVNPWLAQPPKKEVPTSEPQTGGNQYVYYPRFDNHPATPAQAKPAEPVNPWLAPAPEPVKASTSHTLLFEDLHSSHMLTGEAIARSSYTHLPTSSCAVPCRSPNTRACQNLLRIYQSRSRRPERSSRLECRSLSTDAARPCQSCRRPAILLPRT